MRSTFHSAELKKILFSGIILYTFIQFHSTPAIVTSVFIGLAIIFCGCAMVHNVFIWQREKTNAVKELTLQQHEQSNQHFNSHNNIPNPIGNSTVNTLNIPITNPINQSHMSFNHSFMHSPNQIHPPGPYVMRPSTTTPPTAENIVKIAHPREASGSVSPGMPTVTMDLSSVATTNSPHELSTLVWSDENLIGIFQYFRKN